MKDIAAKKNRLSLLAFSLSLALSGLAIAQDEMPENTNAENSTQSEQNPEATTKPEVSRKVPDAESERIAALKAQYPPEDLKKLQASSGEFTALWREDQSGKAFGAILIVPTDGQTANWPHTIDVLRTELPKGGWSTLSIDVRATTPTRAPSRSSSESNTNNMPEADTVNQIEQSDINLERIKSAIEFLHSEGQYNIILLGFGASAERVLNYTQDAKAAGMQKTVRSAANNNMQRPIRAMILVNPKSKKSMPIAPMITSFPYKDMPMLDLIVGTHYLDKLDATQRKQNARSASYEAYIQIQMLEPSNLIFGKENRLSRRVRGFLNKYAKGVEIEK